MRKKRRNKETLQLTNNSNEYKNAKRQLDKIGCPVCPPNRGCNRNRDNDYKSWKRYRKTQWRE